MRYLKNKHLFWLFIYVVFCKGSVLAQTTSSIINSTESEAWSDSVFRTLSYEQKIGQLFMIEAYSNKDTAHVNEVAELIKKYHIGSVIFFQGGPVKQVLMTNYFQSLTKIPLLIGIDGEWGLSMRLDSTIRFPRQMTLGATDNDSLIYQFGKEVGRECRRMGIHLNFAPVADINNNPLNPVINSRSFGEDKYTVTRHAIKYMKGLQDNNVMACGKHFPGHGNTDSDSHLTLPTVNRNLSEIDTLELYPFRELIKEGVAGMMVAHLNIPVLDTTLNLPATLSSNVVDGLLKKKLNFDGLIITDAMNMKGVADHFINGDGELKALQAGNDMILMPPDVPAAWMKIHLAIQNCELSQEDVDEKVKKVLKAKYYAGLNNYQPVDTSNLIQDLNAEHALYLNKLLYESSLTLLNNSKGFLPVRNLSNCSVASLVVNDTLNNPFQEMMRMFAPVNLFRVNKDVKSKDIQFLTEQLSGFDYVILSIHNTSTKADKGYGISDGVDSLISALNKQVNLIVVDFGNPYTLNRMPSLFDVPTVLLAYEDTYLPQKFAAQSIFGAAALVGKTPVAPRHDIPLNSGIQYNSKNQRLRFADPNELGIHRADFSGVDSIANKAINDKATPGCQVLVAWKGKVIYSKSFGKFEYEKNASHVRDTNLYDIASITKIAGTALAVMKLYEEGEIDIDKRASKYFHPLRKTNKSDLIIEDILLHRSGLKSWIPFWKNTMENGRPAFNIYHYEKDVNYSVPVADSLFILNSYIERIWKEIYDSPLEKPGKYIYSDLGMFIMQGVVEESSKQPLDTYLMRNFYEPMGLHRLLFNPLYRFDLNTIVPTEYDTAFRKSLLRGYVHDPAAAMMGGVAGNAGLFSDAFSLATVMQMLMNGGEYGGVRYLKKQTIDKFTSRNFSYNDNRRGLIFDKPEIVPGNGGNAAASASSSAFGHTGFTGTTAWADPDNELIIIFLSNRVHPSADNNKLAKGNYRTDLMEEVYKVIKRTGD